MNKKIIPLLLLTTIVVCSCLCFCSCHFDIGFGGNNKNNEEDESMLSKFDLLLNSLKYADEVYYEDLDLDELDKIAALAVINEMNKFNSMSEYEDATISAAVNQGLGISVSNTIYNEHIVSYVFDKRDNATGEVSLAQPDLKRGDRIYAIDGNRVEGLSVSYLAYYIGLKTEIGDPYDLTIIRDGEQMEVTVKRCSYISRQSYYINDLGGDISDDIGYIKLMSFTGTAESDFKSDIESFISDGNKCLILDLRENGGGSSSILESIASYLVTSNQSTIHLPLIELHEEKVNKVVTYKTKDATKYIDCPIYILTSPSTASASEALISAVKYYETGTIIGTKTYGKGVAQITSNEAVTDNDGKVYSITMVVGRYYVYTKDVETYPGGKYCINEVGIEPDILMEQQSFVGDYSQDEYIVRANALYTSNSD